MKRLLVIGRNKSPHIGYCLYDAAKNLHIEYEICDISNADTRLRPLKTLVWRLFDHRPVYLSQFSQEVIEKCAKFHPDVVLVTGIAPLNAQALRRLKMMGISCANYLTDDPWNKSHKSNWFLSALKEYDVIFTPRHANIADLSQCVPRVVYLPFAYDPITHFWETAPDEQKSLLDCDVFFYGGADEDRLAYIKALINEGIDVHLYGGYWSRYPSISSFAKGFIFGQKLRWATATAKITLCLVRRSNRDGHVMRTFEAPAMGACMLAEDTSEHRDIFGEDKSSVVYFSTPVDLVEKVKYLLNHPELREQLRHNAHRLITSSANTYQDRLIQMLDVFREKR